MKKMITKFTATAFLICTLKLAYSQLITPVTFFGTNTTQGSNLNQLNQPEGILYAADGKIYVTDAGNHRISVWTQSGNTFGNVATFGGIGSGLANFNNPRDIAQSTDGKLFITDQGNNRVSVWNVIGNNYTAVTTFGGIGAASNQFDIPGGLAITNNGRIFIGDVGNSRISVWTISGSSYLPFATFGTTYGSANNQFSSPLDVAIGTNGNLFIADADNNRISVWTTSGSNFGVLTVFGTNIFFGGGTSPIDFTYPVAVTLDGSGKIFVTDQGNSRISIWTQTGNTFGFLTSIGGVYGTALNQLANPSSVTLLPDGKILIGDQLARVSVWQNCVTPAIVSQPISQTVCGGSMANFVVSTTGVVSNYLWSNGSTTPSMQTNLAGSYTVTVSGVCGSVTSTAAQLTVNSGTVITNITATSPVIAAGSNTTLSVLATGTNLAYLWSNGATTPSFQTNVAGEYFVTVAGTCNSADTSITIGNLVLAAENNGYSFVTSFGSFGFDDNQLWQPSDVQVSDDGKIFIANRANYRIAVWTQSGNNFGYSTTLGTFPIEDFEGGSLGEDLNLTIGKDGKIFVSSGGNSKISVFTQSGNNFGNVASLGVGRGSGNNQFDRPEDLTFAPDGKIYIADQFNHRVSIWTQSGNNFGYLTQFGSFNVFSDDSFSGPQSVVVTSDGKVCVSDRINKFISVWTQSGNNFGFLSTFGKNEFKGNHVGIDSKNYSVSIGISGKIYVAEAINNIISVWTQSGSSFGKLTSFGGFGTGNGQLNSPQSVFEGKDGKVYVAERGNHRISVWQAPTPIFYTQVTFDVTAPTTFTGNTATLTWPTIAGVGNLKVKYCLRISKDKTFGSIVKTVCGLTGNSYNYDPNASNRVEESNAFDNYYFQVQAVDSVGNTSQWSATQTFLLNTTSTAIAEEDETEKISIYPNPISSNLLTVDNAAEGASISIFTVQGQFVLGQKASGGISQIDISMLPGGVYFIKISSIVLKLIRQ
ncbi:MAG: T9SS type A sorting domain-containing protein [Cytophagales bacterium]